MRYVWSICRRLSPSQASDAVCLITCGPIFKRFSFTWGGAEVQSMAFVQMLHWWFWAWPKLLSLSKLSVSLVMVNEWELGFLVTEGVLASTVHCYKRYLKWSPPLENCSSGNGKRPRWCRNILSLGHTGILHSSRLEMSSGMEECKITAWARNILSLAHAGILHSPMPEMSEEGLIF